MNLQELRKKSQLTQQEIALKLSVNRSTYAMWETGKSAPKINDIINIAKVLGVSEKEVLDCFKR